MFGTLVRLQGFVRRGSPAGVALVAIAVIAGCGSSNSAVHLSSSAHARSLLQQTAAAQHRVRSGVIAVTLALTPMTPGGGPNPISVSLEGPFQNRGDRRLPDADLNVSISARNKTRSLSLVSAGGAHYVTIGSDSYELPTSSSQMLDSRTANGATASADLSNLGIRPQDWAVNPRVVGSDQIDGVATTRIHARIDAEKLVADLSALLPKLASLGLSSSIGQLSSVIGRLPKRLPAAGQRRVAAEMHDPYVDLWTGSSDRILRKLILSFEIPAGAQTAGKVGGSRVVTLTLQYSDLNRPQTIVAPTKTQPYAALDAKVNALAQQFGVGTSSTTPSTDTTPRTDSTPHQPRAEPNRVPELTLSPYARCIANAAGDFTKMRRCASLSNGTSTRGR